jgi:hypothetical protein
VEEVPQAALFVREPSQDVIPYFVEGYAFGEAIGIGVRSVSNWWTLKSVSLNMATSEVRHYLISAPRNAYAIPL